MDYDSSIPIYLQVIDRIKKDIVTGKLPLGSKLPSTRELALDMGINANTAARIYKELEMMDVAFTKRGIGTFVTESTDMLSTIKNELKTAYITNFMDHMKGIGLSTKEVIEMLKAYEEKE